jgi:signal transduction histidine kinase/CheY-like chemotaxis protein
MLSFIFSGNHFKSNLTLFYEDTKLEDLYRTNKYSFRKYLLAGIFFIIYGIINVTLYWYFLDISLQTHQDGNLTKQALNVQLSLVIVQTIILFFFILVNFKVPYLRNNIFILESVICTIGVYLNSHITRNYATFIGTYSNNSYTIPFLHAIIIYGWIIFIENNYMINFISCLIAYILIACFAIDLDWRTSDGIIYLVISILLYSGLSYIIQRNDKNVYYINYTIRKELDNTKELVNNLNAGIVSIARECLSVSYNNKVKEYLTDVNQHKTDEDDPFTIGVKQFLFEGIDINPDLDQNIINELRRDIDLYNEDEVNMIIAKLFEYANFTQYIYMGNKKYKAHNSKEHTVRMYIRFNKLSDSLEFILEDVSNIIYVETLKAQDKYKNMFLNKFSHEFKNPLLNIVQLVKNIRANSTQMSKKNLNYLATFGITKQDAHKELRYIKHLCKYMLNLIHDFDYISKVNIRNNAFVQRKSQLGFQAEIKNYDLKKLLKQIIRVFQTRAELADKDLKIYTRIDDNVPGLIYTDSHKLQQVLFNLLSNSFKFTAYGEILLEVHKTHHDYIEFIIADTGQGMTDETKNKLCSPFFKSDSDTNMYGIGLGLFIVKSILDQFSSTLKIETEYGAGTRISFAVPNKLKTISFKSTKTMGHMKSNDDPTSLLQKINEKIVITDGKLPGGVIKRTRTAFHRYSIKIIDELQDEKVSSRSNESPDSHRTAKQFVLNDESFQTKSTVVLNTLQFDFEKYNQYLEATTAPKEIFTEAGSPVLPNRRRTLNRNPSFFGLEDNSRRYSLILEDDAINILVVDDEKLIRQSNIGVLTKFFNSIKRKINIVECTDGAECLYQLFAGTKKGLTFHLIAIDETMNFMRGSMTSRIIRTLIEDGVLYDVKICMVTSYEPSIINSKYPGIFSQVYSKPLTKDCVKDMYSFLI